MEIENRSVWKMGCIGWQRKVGQNSDSWWREQRLWWDLLDCEFWIKRPVPVMSIKSKCEKDLFPHFLQTLISEPSLNLNLLALFNWILYCGIWNICWDLLTVLLFFVFQFKQTKVQYYNVLRLFRKNCPAILISLI